MIKLLLSAVAVMTVSAAMFAPSLVARAQSTVRFEYARIAPHRVSVTQGREIHFRVGYRACLATTDEWTCRDFEPRESSDAALRTALATLGNEGWELVSAVDADPNSSHELLTYLFKRPRQ